MFCKIGKALPGYQKFRDEATSEPPIKRSEQKLMLAKRTPIVSVNIYYIIAFLTYFSRFVNIVWCNIAAFKTGGAEGSARERFRNKFALLNNWKNTCSWAVLEAGPTAAGAINNGEGRIKVYCKKDLRV